MCRWLGDRSQRLTAAIRRYLPEQSDAHECLRIPPHRRLSHESSTRDGDSLGWCGVGDREDHRLGYNFVAADRDQLMLMPPSVADWLPEDHLAWFVLDVVAELDLSAFYAVYRLDGRGGASCGQFQGVSPHTTLVDAASFNCDHDKA